MAGVWCLLRKVRYGLRLINNWGLGDSLPQGRNHIRRRKEKRGQLPGWEDWVCVCVWGAWGKGRAKLGLQWPFQVEELLEDWEMCYSAPSVWIYIMVLLWLLWQRPRRRGAQTIRKCIAVSVCKVDPQGQGLIPWRAKSPLVENRCFKGTTQTITLLVKSY